jgi:hypothetical protein
MSNEARSSQLLRFPHLPKNASPVSLQAPYCNFLFNLKINSSLEKRQRRGLAPPVGVSKSEWVCLLGPACCDFTKGYSCVCLSTLQQEREQIKNINEVEVKEDLEYIQFWSENFKLIFDSENACEFLALIPLKQQDQKDFIIECIPELKEIIHLPQVTLFLCPKHFFATGTHTPYVKTKHKRIAELSQKSFTIDNLRQIDKDTVLKTLSNLKKKGKPKFRKFVVSLKQRWTLKLKSLNASSEGECVQIKEDTRDPLAELVHSTIW